MSTNGTNGVNGHGPVSRPLRPGIFAPIPTFFEPQTEDLDLQSLEAQVLRLAKAGVYPLLAGSMGEGHHLTAPERITLIRTARQALDSAGLSQVPIISGIGVGSTRETVALAKDAAEAGADYAIAIASGYFAGALTGNKAALKAFWIEVSEKSPIPVIVYNYPGAAGGINLDSDILVELATQCPNLAGVKLTCGDVGKQTRVCATVSDTAFATQYPRKNPDAPFLVLGGFADFILPSTFTKGHGAIIGLANVAPYTCARLQELSVAAYTDRSDTASLAEAQRLQGLVARADYTIAKTSISGTKYLLEKLYGYGGLPRRPLPPVDTAVAEALWEHPDVRALVQEERELSGKAGGKR